MGKKYHRVSELSTWSLRELRVQSLSLDSPELLFSCVWPALCVAAAALRCSVDAFIQRLPLRYVDAGRVVLAGYSAGVRSEPPAAAGQAPFQAARLPARRCVPRRHDDVRGDEFGLGPRRALLTGRRRRSSLCQARRPTLPRRPDSHHVVAHFVRTLVALSPAAVIEL